MSLISRNINTEPRPYTPIVGLQAIYTFHLSLYNTKPLLLYNFQLLEFNFQNFAHSHGFTCFLTLLGRWEISDKNSKYWRGDTAVRSCQIFHNLIKSRSVWFEGNKLLHYPCRGPWSQCWPVAMMALSQNKNICLVLRNVICNSTASYNFTNN